MIKVFRFVDSQIISRTSVALGRVLGVHWTTWVATCLSFALCGVKKLKFFPKIVILCTWLQL